MRLGFLAFLGYISQLDPTLSPDFRDGSNFNLMDGQV
jgi:hypothetical protein